jgi:exodeoxyribonuclease-3
MDQETTVIEPVIGTVTKSKQYKIISWNVDGLRDEIWPFLTTYLEEHKPDILCLNETKKSEEYLRVLFSQLIDYNFILNSHHPWKWHGVAMLIRKGIRYQELSLELHCSPRYDNKSCDAGKGRLIGIILDNKYHVVTTYSCNSGQGLKNLDYRINCWDKALFQLLNRLDGSSLSDQKDLNELDKTLPVIWIGDINVANNTIDVSHPETMKLKAGFSFQPNLRWATPKRCQERIEFQEVSARY